MINIPYIIGISGKKQSGKNTLCNSLEEYIKVKYGMSCKIYSFADALKENVCMKTMGLTYEQCYGSDEQKNSLTIYKWENLPREIRHDNKLGCEYAPNGEICEYILPTGFMTAREILQIVGTDIFRKYFDDSIWVNATFRNIFKENFEVALISDVRFPSEIEGVINKEGNVIRLLRNVCKADSHESETVLDDYDFSIHGDEICLIDNTNMSIEEQNIEAVKYIESKIKNEKNLL